MTILQTALKTIETLLTDNASEQAQAAAADARIKLANAMAHVPEADFGNIVEPVPSGERAELIARLIRKANAWDYLHPHAKRPNDCRDAADMLEADAQQAKPTDWSAA